MRLLLVLICALFGSAPLICADSDKPSDEAVGAVLAKIGKPARAVAVQAALSEARREGGDAEVVLAIALGRAGGSAAVDGLSELIRRGDRATRLCAIESARRVGLRSKALLSALRRSLEKQSLAVRLAACMALGYVGDGRDVPTLLEMILEREPRVRLAAYQSLGRLSGASKPHVPAKWEYWWKTMEKKADEKLVPALETLTEDPSISNAAELLASIKRLAWLRLEMVEKTLSGWLEHGDKGLRATAARLAGELGLTDLAPKIERRRRFAATDAQRALMDEALERLGLPPEKEE